MSLGIHKILKLASKYHVSKFSNRKYCKHDFTVVSTTQKILPLLLFLFLLSSNFIGFAQVNIWSEDFSSYANNSGVEGLGVTTIGDYPASVSKWTIDASGTGLLNSSDYFKVNSGHFRGRDVNGKGIWQSESIDISSFSNVIVSSFFWKAGGTMESTDSINFYYRINSGAWTAIVLLNDDISTTPTKYTVTNLNGNSLELKIEIAVNGGNEIYAFDDVVVEGTPTSPPSCTTPISPTNGAVDFAVDGSLTWNSVAAATGYKIYFGTNNPPTNIENNEDLGNVTSYTPSSDMNFLTDYYWKIVPYNGIGSATGCSVWSFTTADISYCAAGADDEDEYISRVRLNNDIDNSSSWSTNGYGDYTGLSTSLTQGETNVSLIIDIGTYYSNDDISVWVDWNQDGDFDDSGENIICENSVNASGSNPFDVPATANLGNTRMRIRLEYYSTSCPSTSCGNTTYGEVEDYTINIQAACNAPDEPTLSATSTTICNGSSSTLSISLGNLNDADHWQWYSGSCGGTAIGTGTSVSVSPAITTTYYARGEGTCDGTTCGDITISIADIQIPLITDITDATCPNSADGAIDLSVPFPIQFNGSDYIDIGTTLLSNQSAFTLEGWIKTDDFSSMPSRTSLFGQNDVIEFFFNGSTLMCWTVSGGSVSTGSYPTDNLWHHIAAVGNGTDIRLYIDGVLIATGVTSTTNYGSNTYTSKIGAGVVDPTGGTFPGQMVKVGFYSTALTNTEIGSLASEYYHYTGSETGLLAGYNFYEGTGTTLGSEVSSTDGTFSGSPTWVNNYTYTWTKTGDAGFSETTQDLTNVTPGTYIVTVTNSSLGCDNSDSWTINSNDTEDPTITCATPAGSYNNDAGECYYIIPDNSLDPTATGDNCAVASVVNNFNSTSTLNGAQFPVGTTTVIWTVTDDAGNSATCGQTITIEDNEDPTITCPANILVSADAGQCSYSGGIGTPITSDNCPGETASNNAPATFPIGVTIVTWTVTDAAGNSATCGQTITVEDNEDPTITCPANILASADAGQCSYSGGIGTPITSDNCPGETASNNAPATFPMGVTTVVWTVTDAVGNTATCNQTVTVEPAVIIDVAVVDLGNSCQSGETGSTTTITWDVNLLQGSNSWTYDYTINDGTNDVQTGTGENATGNIQISYIMNNETAVNKTYTITLTNVKDNCGVAEINTGNNSDVATLYGVPNTGEIIPD